MVQSNSTILSELKASWLRAGARGWSLHAIIVACLLFGGARARAELHGLEVVKREPFAGGHAFGDVGPYERILGVAHFAVDPQHLANRSIVDLDMAPRNADGKVEFEADVFMLAPKDLSKGNGAIFYDVNNRGNKLALGLFNRGGGGNDPKSLADAGDGFLMRRGYTIVWCGWIGELLSGDGRLLLRAPVATQNGQSIRGVVRYEMVADAPAETLPLSRRDGHGSYPPTAHGEATATLTWRMRETDARIPIPRGQWTLERLPISKVEKGIASTLPQIRMRLAGGFRPGYIYEFISEAEGPIVQGLGFAATRDLISFLRYDGSPRNPLNSGQGKPPVITRAHAFGVSQSGRFLRHMVYQGFNQDEAVRRVFDGLIPHVAGGGLGFFNHRFAQPTRHNGQHEEHLFPGDMFPFTYGESLDPYSSRRDGILRGVANQTPKLVPRIMHTQSAAEYWHRSGSLVHTDPLGHEDASLPPSVRLYTFGGTQHGPAADPPSRGIAENLHNPGNYRPLLKALLDALDAWVREERQPPPSIYPSIAGGTLVPWHQAGTGFPAIPGVRYPEVIQQPAALDFGPHFATKSVLTTHPPRLLGQYTVLVPKCGFDGNDLGTLLPPEVAVPLATHTGWNLRKREAGAEGMLASLLGSYIPFPRTRSERLGLGDPRESIEERYGTFDEYARRFTAACDDLIQKRYLLPEDAERLKAGREKRRGQFPTEAQQKAR